MRCTPERNCSTYCRQDAEGYRRARRKPPRFHTLTIKGRFGIPPQLSLPLFDTPSCVSPHKEKIPVFPAMRVRRVVWHLRTFETFLAARPFLTKKLFCGPLDLRVNSLKEQLSNAKRRRLG